MLGRRDSRAGGPDLHPIVATAVAPGSRRGRAGVAPLPFRVPEPELPTLPTLPMLTLSVAMVAPENMPAIGGGLGAGLAARSGAVGPVAATAATPAKEPLGRCDERLDALDALEPVTATAATPFEEPLGRCGERIKAELVEIGAGADFGIEGDSETGCGVHGDEGGVWTEEGCCCCCAGGRCERGKRDGPASAPPTPVAVPKSDDGLTPP